MKKADTSITFFPEESVSNLLDFGGSQTQCQKKKSMHILIIEIHLKSMELIIFSVLLITYDFE